MIPGTKHTVFEWNEGLRDSIGQHYHICFDGKIMGVYIIFREILCQSHLLQYILFGEKDRNSISVLEEI